MRTTPTLGTSEDVLASAAEEVRPIGHALRALIGELHPDATEVSRQGERSVAYAYGEQKMSEASASKCCWMP